MSHTNVRPVGGALDSDHLYYNITFSNDNTGTDVDVSGNIVELSTQGKDLVFNFTQTRAQPYLSRPKDYYLSVVRFTIESPNLPVFIAQPIVGESNVDKTIYSITIADTSGNFYQQNVKWVPQDLTQPIPPSPVTQGHVSPALPYYYCYSYNHFIKCINDTFSYIFTLNMLPGTPPYMYFDATTKLFQLGGDVNLYRTKIDGSPLGSYSIIFNTELLNLFSSLPATYIANVIPNRPLTDYVMILSTGSDVPTAAPQPYINFVRPNVLASTNDVYSLQEYVTLPLWTPVTAIMFKTSLLSVAPENMATPIVYENGTQNINAGKQNAEIFNMLIDHYSPLTDGTEYKPYIYYEPTGEYKLTDLYGEKEVNAIDISVFWRDNFGNLIPFKIGIGCSATIKIMFRKKTFNSD